MQDIEYIDENVPIFQDEQPLASVEPFTPAAVETEPQVQFHDQESSSQSAHKPSTRLTPGREILFQGFQRPGRDRIECVSEDYSDSSSATADHMEPVLNGHPPSVDGGAEIVCSADELKNTAAAGLAAAEKGGETLNGVRHVPSTIRVDSAQDEIPQLAPDKRPSRGKSPLRLKTQEPQSQTSPSVGDTIATSPMLRKHSIPVEEGAANTIPPVQQPTSPAQDGAISSPLKEPLPSFRQLTNQIGQLNELAEVAVTQPYSHHGHKQSFSSATSQSPGLPYHPHPYHVSAQTSPITYSSYTARSPTSTVGESQHYGSPQQHYATAAYYTDRRPSVAADAAPSFPPSLPSASSSGDSHGGHTSSGTEGYPSSHTTPTDLPPLDGMAQPQLPPPHGLPQTAMMNAGFRCDWPGCTAYPFQTQYLLRFVCSNQPEVSD